MKHLKLLATLFLLTGCGDIVGDRIDSICACEGCSDRRLEEQEILVNAEFDVAETYDCVEILEPYWECQLDRHECKDSEYKDDNDECGDQFDEYNQCLTAKSSREPGPY